MIPSCQHAGYEVLSASIEVTPKFFFFFIFHFGAPARGLNAKKNNNQVSGTVGSWLFKLPLKALCSDDELDFEAIFFSMEVSFQHLSCTIKEERACSDQLLDAAHLRGSSAPLQMPRFLIRPEAARFSRSLPPRGAPDG